MLWQKKNRLAKKTIPCKSVWDGERQRPWRQWHGQTKWIDPILSVIQYWQPTTRHDILSSRFLTIIERIRHWRAHLVAKQSRADHTRRQARVPETESTITTSHNKTSSRDPDHLNQQQRAAKSDSDEAENKQWNINTTKTSENKIWISSERQTGIDEPKNKKNECPTQNEIKEKPLTRRSLTHTGDITRQAASLVHFQSINIDFNLKNKTWKIREVENYFITRLIRRTKWSKM